MHPPDGRADKEGCGEMPPSIFDKTRQTRIRSRLNAAWWHLLLHQPPSHLLVGTRRHRNENSVTIMRISFTCQCVIPTAYFIYGSSHSWPWGNRDLVKKRLRVLPMKNTENSHDAFKNKRVTSVCNRLRDDT